MNRLRAIRAKIHRQSLWTVWHIGYTILLGALAMLDPNPFQIFLLGTIAVLYAVQYRAERRVTAWWRKAGEESLTGWENSLALNAALLAMNRGYEVYVEELKREIAHLGGTVPAGATTGMERIIEEAHRKRTN